MLFLAISYSIIHRFSMFLPFQLMLVGKHSSKIKVFNINGSVCNGYPNTENFVLYILYALPSNPFSKEYAYKL